jgi:hypothetical protein
MFNGILHFKGLERSQGKADLNNALRSRYYFTENTSYSNYIVNSANDVQEKYDCLI